MSDTDLFLSLAEIAGVFIGFGALIAVRSAGTPSTLDAPTLAGRRADCSLALALGHALEVARRKLDCCARSPIDSQRLLIDRRFRPYRDAVNGRSAADGHRQGSIRQP